MNTTCYNRSSVDAVTGFQLEGSERASEGRDAGVEAGRSPDPGPLTEDVKGGGDGAPELIRVAAARLNGGGVPARVLIVPWGKVQSSSGDFVVDAESARLVVQAFHEHGTDLPIDYEHQTLGGRYTAPSGQAPAAGWIKRIEAEAEAGIFAEVAWTEPALEQLAARQYRYLSPVALIRKSDRKLIGLHSVALTNKPAIANMTPIVNRRDGEPGVVGNAHPTGSVGGAEPVVGNAHPTGSVGGAEPVVGSAHPTGLTSAAEVMAGLRERLGLAPESEDVEVLAAAGRRLEEVAQETVLREAQRRVTEAQRQGRLTEAQRDWALSLAQKDTALFDEWLRTAPVVVALGRTEPTASADRSTSRRKAAAEVARLEFRSCPALGSITSEAAYVAAALRESN